MLDPGEAYTMYVRTKVVFTTGTIPKPKSINLIKRNDRVMFDRFCIKFRDFSKDEISDVFVAVFKDNPNTHISEFVSDNALKLYFKHRKIHDGLSYWFLEDLNLIGPIVEGLTSGKIFNLMINGKISLDTLAIIDSVSGGKLVKFFDRAYSDGVKKKIWKQKRSQILGLKQLGFKDGIDTKRFMSILKDHQKSCHQFHLMS